ncbi:CDP-glucose 4,6-dehydratase [Laribacter hongkongensis]|uniref:CDP-glucose 4,6-dehydratase n=1 Tax=Laribacter hongkongensis TaxID=168471 RepID=UPI001EFC920D|nr:CDP-glucose 4,6-dehydratase [Laribacter hongkongensis]MCG9064514.1 CDP-glucose 4,6-dehydratase [Laribacter hongkongensis]
MNAAFWHGKHVLITGHTGFKGGWLALWLQRLGAHIYGIALPPTTSLNLFELARVPEDIDSHFCDIRDAEYLTTLIRDCRPEIVLHLAAQPLVHASYRDPLKTFSCNIMGTAHVLDALRGLDSVRVALMVTTDKVYHNLEQPYPYREGDTLGGHDPYSSSKAASEIVIASYRDAFLKEQGIAVASARAGNVVGGGDWSENRLIPDAIRAWQADEILNIRQPQAIRPWQHVLEPLHGYLTLAEKLWHRPELAGAYNFGPHTHEAATVHEVVELARKAYGKGNVRYGDSNNSPHEAGWLTLETAKARMTLGVQPRWSLAETITRTMAWYQAKYAGADARELCLTEIAQYGSREGCEAQS